MVAPFICKICSRKFTTHTHLRRHNESQHLSKLNHGCFFCSSVFHRRDIARRHAKTCLERCGRPLPKIEKGRPRASCDNCALAKKLCDKEDPCGYCEGSSLSCTYTRVELRPKDPSRRVPGTERNPDVFIPSDQEIITATGNSEAKNPMTDSGNPDSDTLTKARIPFLLNYYNANNTLLDMCQALDAGHTNVSDPVDLPDQATFISPDIQGLNTEDVNWEFPYSSPEDIEQSSYATGIEQNNDTTPQKTPNRLADHRLGESLSERALEIPKILKPFAQGPMLKPRLDNAIDQNLFSLENIQYFEYLYRQHSHKHCPIIHLPTFDAESTTMSLLLTVFLGGSLHSYPRDTFYLAADCFDIVESYLFSLPNFQAGYTSQIDHEKETSVESQTKSHYESLKAAVILLHLQFGRNDPEIRRRIRYHRFPILVQIARSLSLFKSKHNHSSTSPGSWIWEPHTESLIRTAHYILLLDCQFTICLRSPAMIMISELTGHLPCAETRFHHDQRFSSVKIARPSSLVETIDLLMDDTLNEYNSHFGIFGLFTVITGLHLILFSTFTSRMIKYQSAPLERALTRWKELWDKELSETSNEEVQLAGFMANANEIWLVAKVLLKTDLNNFYNGLDSQSFKPFMDLLHRVHEVNDD